MNITLRRACPRAVKQLCGEGAEPLVARALAARGISCFGEVEPPLKLLPDPETLPGASAAAELLAEAIEHRHWVHVVGDYDVDGMTATTLAVECLRQMGARVSWKIPSRERDGYGLTPALADEAGDAKVLLTVDNGICAFEGVARARQRGMKVCVTDHHLSKARLPEADCIVNPNVGGGRFAAPHIAGVGVIFYVMAALKARMKSSLDMGKCLDLVALGTIADCARMDSVNRALTAAGLQRMRRNAARPAVAALASTAHRTLSSLTCRDIGYAIAPRLNAAGRLDRAQAAMECLMADNEKEALQNAEKLEILNSERIQRQKEVSQAAHLLLDAEAAGIAVFGEEFHAGVGGIVASDICSQYCRPAIVFSRARGGWKGSGRAPAGWDLYAIVRRVNDAHPHCIAAFGGHARALGVTLADNRRQMFGDLFAEECARVRQTLAPPQLQVDTYLPGEINLVAVKQMESLAWGEGFPEPRFAGEFDIVSKRLLRGGHLQMTLAANGERFAAVFFNPPALGVRLKAIFQISLKLSGDAAQLIIQRELE